MPEAYVVKRAAVLDQQQKLMGYYFFWRQPVNTTEGFVAKARETLVWISGLFGQDQERDQPAGLRYYFRSPAALLSDDGFCDLPRSALGLIVLPEDLKDAVECEAMQMLRQEGCEIVLRIDDLAALQPELFNLVDLVEVRFEAGNFSAQAKIYGVLKNTSVHMLASRVEDWREMAVCHKLGLSTVVGDFYYTLPPDLVGEQKALNPAQVTLLRVMDAVQANAEINVLEELLKHDAGISYKLLFYINSAAFGLGFEIKSLRHAIQMLGYRPLYRWLCVLLATSDSGHVSSVLLQTALMRGRMMELLGAKLLSSQDVENLFIVGMFSLLDRLLGVEMTQAIDQIRLPESVLDALLDNTGVFHSVLELVKACELPDDTVLALADVLGVALDDINVAHAKAIGWSHSLVA